MRSNIGIDDAGSRVLDDPAYADAMTVSLSGGLREQVYPNDRGRLR